MKNKNVKQLVTLGLLTAILLVMAWTPLGYLNIGPLAITLNIIPLAVAAITLGAFGGGVCGAVFGITSFLQCIGIGGLSPLGEALFAINPFLTFVLCFVPRVLDGVLSGLLFGGLKKRIGAKKSCYITGFAAAFLNTALFMSTLVFLFGSTDYIRGLMGGKNLLAFVCAFVGINAVFEMLACTAASGAVGNALLKR